MLYVRGHPRDYDIWRQLGNEGWSYEDVLPYFKKSEKNENGSSEFHGSEGELGVQNPTFENNPLHRCFLDAGVQAGYKYKEDLNGMDHEGFGTVQQTIWKGKRASTGQAYIKPIKDRKNLTIFTKSITNKLIFDGKKCIGLEYIKGKNLNTRPWNRIKPDYKNIVRICSSPLGIGCDERLNNRGRAWQ